MMRTLTASFTPAQVECINLLADVFGGQHNMHGKIDHAGDGIVYTFAGDGGLSTFDSNRLTTAVFLAHDRCIRLDISPASSRHLRIYAHKRQPAGSITQRHPTMEQAIAMHRRYYPTQETRKQALADDTLLTVDASTETWQPADAAPFGVVVLAHFLTRHGKSRVIRATRVAPYTVLDDSDYNYGTDYDEKTGEYYLKAGWYERLVCGDYDYYSVDAVVTHYMPLPLPPEATHATPTNPS